MRDNNGSIDLSKKTKRIVYIVMISCMMLLIFTTSASALYIIQEFGTDGYRYLNGSDLTVSGKLMNDSTGEANANITLIIRNSTSIQVGEYNTTTDTNGRFSQVIPASQTGTFSITSSAADFGLTSPAVNVIVYDINAIKNVFASFTIGTAHAVTLNETGSGNITINGTNYDFSVSTSNTASVRDGSNEVENLVTNSRLKLGGNTYIVFFINRSSEIVLIRPVQPVFTGSESFSNLTLLTLNSSNYPLSGRNIVLKISNSSGFIEQINPSSTNPAGITVANITISNISGMYNIQILEDNHPLGSITYSINSYDVAGNILSADWTPQHTFARGQGALLSASVKTTAGAIYNNTRANVTAFIRGPGGYSLQGNMSFEQNRSVFYYNYIVPGSATRGTYNVEYLITIGTQTLKTYGSFDVKGYNLFLKPISCGVKELEGFSPGERGFILVSGTDIGNGDIVNVNSSTGASNRSNFTFSLRSSEGRDVTGSWGVMGLKAFFATEVVPEWLQDEITVRAPNASVINFTTPGASGIYNARVTVNLNGTTEETSTGISVQDIFLYAFPVSSDGSPAMSVSSQANITLRIEAFNPKTMTVETGIVSAGIIEAFAVDANSIVTDKMLTPSLISLPDGSKGLRFFNNDTNMGFHMVKFWANITKTDGNVTRTMGTGFFDVKQYLIWASPELTESGNFKTFTSNSDISMRVQVMNTGFSPQSGKQVSIDEVRYGQNWEKVDFDTYNNSANISATTDSNGIANLSFDPSNSLKSGWYDVRIKLIAQDTSGNYITEYGRGWFEVRSFMFWAYPTSWNVKSGQNISFNLKAINSSNMSSLFNTTVRIKKILHRSDWSQPPREVPAEGGYHPVNGSSTVNILTNTSTEAMVVYTGGLTTKAGIYEFVFEATDPASGAIEETRVMIETRSFAAWVNLPNGQWNNKFGINTTINLIVHAGNNNGDTSTVLDAARTNITSVTKMGMFGGTPYKKRSDLNITNVASDSQDHNAVNITLSLTSWQEGSYDMVINAVDTSGNEVVTHFWIEVEVATVGLPEFYRVMVPSDRIVTRRTSFYLSDSPSEKVGNGEYSGLTNDVASNFTNARIGSINILGSKMDSGMDWGLPESPKVFWALVNLTEPRSLHINFKNANFSETNLTYTQNLTEGETFYERDANFTVVRRWNVTSIGSDGTVILKGIDSLRNTYIVDPSLSKSGKFLAWGNMEDNQWLKVDLDGNNQYGREWNNRNNVYYILLADNTTAGVYDTVLISNTTNFTRDGINATNSSTPVTFGGNPIYFISLKKEGSDYMALFTSYTAGMGGMWLGTFEKGKTFNIPFLVQQPGSTTGIAGAVVTVDKLTWYMPGYDQIITPAATATTNENGLAVVSIDTTDIPTGQYLISYRVLLPSGQVKAATDTWKMPGVEIRKFVVSAEFGTIGSISTHLVTNGSGLTILRGDRIEPKGVTWANHRTPDVYRVGWPFDMGNEYYFNASDGHYYTGFNAGRTTGSWINNNSINLTREGSNTTYNFTQFYPEGYNVSVSGTTPQRVFQYWNISIWDDGGARIGIDGDGNYAYLRIDYLLDNMQNSMEHPNPENKFYVGQQIFWGPGELNVRIVEINTTAPGTVILQTMNPKIIYKSESLNMLIDGNPSNGEWASGSVIKLSSYQGYDVYGYNDREDSTMMQNASYNCNGGCWTPTLSHVLVKNETTAMRYRVGVEIPEFGNNYAGLVSEWAGKMIFVDQTRGHGIYPYSDWAPDGDSYFVGTFSEYDVKVDLNNNGSNRDSQTYYIRLEDGSKNGVFTVTRGIFDDDADFTEGRGNSQSLGRFDAPLDLFTEEQGQIVDTGRGYRLDERYITLGSLQGWPFAVPEITYADSYANLTTFSPRFEPFDLTENVTLYVGARKFTNEPINGNVSLEKLVVLFKVNQSDIMGGGGGGMGGAGPGTGTGGNGGKGPSDGMMIPDVYSNFSVKKPILNGLAVWEINYTTDLLPVVGSFDSGQFIAMLNVTDTEGNFEVIERQFMLQNRSSFGKGNFGCPQEPCGPVPTPEPSPEESKVVQISSPRNNSILSQDEIMMLEGTVSGNPDEYNFTWISNHDGYIGNTSGIANSSKIIRFDLSPGNHEITLNVTNSTGGFINNSRIFLNIVPVNKINISGMNASGQMRWNFTNFPAFWNENGNSSETLSVVNIADRNISTNGLFYNITRQIMPYEVFNSTGITVPYGLSSDGAKVSNGGYYAKIGLLGRPYIAIGGKSNKLAHIVREDNKSYVKILNMGEEWDLGRGYSLKLIGVNSTATPMQAYLDLNRSGFKISDVVINNGYMFAYIVPELGRESDVPMFVTYAANVSALSVELKYTFLISDYDPVRIIPGDGVGHNSAVLVVVESGTYGIVSTNHYDTVDLTKGPNFRLAHKLRLIVNNTDPLDYYPSMAVPIGGN